LFERSGFGNASLLALSSAFVSLRRRRDLDVTFHPETTNQHSSNTETGMTPKYAQARPGWPSREPIAAESESNCF
jgi:hypothetical protein